MQAPESREQCVAAEREHSSLRSTARSGLYRMALIIAGGIAAALQPPHDVRAQEQRAPVKVERSDAEDDDAETNEQEELPVFKTMEEWAKSPLLIKDDGTGVLDTMGILSEKMALSKTSIERQMLKPHIIDLANMILHEVGNPPPPAVMNKLRLCDRNLSKPLLEYLWDHALDFPLKIQAGDVSGALTVEYINKTMAFPLEVVDETTQRILRETRMRIGRKQTFCQTMAHLCNASHVDMDVGPIGDERHFCNEGVPRNLYLLHRSPFVNSRYRTSQNQPGSIGMDCTESRIEGSGEWKFYYTSSEGGGQGARSEGCWAPESVTIQRHDAQAREPMAFSLIALPLRDPESGKLLIYDAGRGAVCFSDDPALEKSLMAEPPHIAWAEPRSEFFALEPWHYKRVKKNWVR